MGEGMPWGRWPALGALLVVFGVAAVGLGLLAVGHDLGWLYLFLATWLVIGLVATAAGSAGGES